SATGRLEIWSGHEGARARGVRRRVRPSRRLRAARPALRAVRARLRPSVLSRRPRAARPALAASLGTWVPALARRDLRPAAGTLPARLGRPRAPRASGRGGGRRAVVLGVRRPGG